MTGSLARGTTLRNSPVITGESTNVSEGDRGEVNFIPALASDRERRAELPSVGNFQAGGVVDVVGLVALGIEQDLVPTDDGQLVSGGGASGESALEGTRGGKGSRARR